MFLKIISQSSKVDSTPFSNFVRSSASGHKKKVFVSVLKISTSEQKKVIETAATAA
tara:strand:- start:60 stop:227 length:168 start_codon:yes stop_codon:yes gene_type:complete